MGSGTEAHPELAVSLGAWLAREGFDLLTGGGGGVMQAVAQAFTAVAERRGISIGIIPGELEGSVYVTKSGYPNPFVELPIYTHLPKSGKDGKDPMSRNHINVLSATALVVLPGAEGTLSEAELAVLYGRLAVLHGPVAEFRGFPARLQRCERLADVQRWVKERLRS
jgi:uncharacterized protein (TIGR00725 family)